MKKLWGNYSYAIILVAVSLIFSIAAKIQFNSDHAYITVTIEEGQSLWEIAEAFTDDHSLSKNEFISWVQEENGLTGDVIHPGDELVIPVMADQEEMTQIAGAER